MNIYFISGLGVDERAFVNIHLPDEFSVHHIKWIKPGKTESISDYAKRLTEQIDQSKPFAVVGLSFGGLIAVEISKLIPVKKIIIISSIADSKQLPWHFKVAGKLNLVKIIPLGLMHKWYAILFWAFGVKTDDEKKFLRLLNDHPDIEFNRWALDKVMKWSGEGQNNIIQIHGTEDRLFSINSMKPDYVINGGGHFMIYTHGAEISGILTDVLH